MQRWLWVVLVLLAWPVLGTVTGRGANVPAGDAARVSSIAAVAVRDNSFEPSALEIAPGHDHRLDLGRNRFT